jgi:hypothetical protein
MGCELQKSLVEPGGDGGTGSLESEKLAQSSIESVARDRAVLPDKDEHSGGKLIKRYVAYLAPDAGDAQFDGALPAQVQEPV